MRNFHNQNFEINCSGLRCSKIQRAHLIIHDRTIKLKVECSAEFRWTNANLYSHHCIWLGPTLLVPCDSHLQFSCSFNQQTAIREIRRQSLPFQSNRMKSILYFFYYGYLLLLRNWLQDIRPRFSSLFSFSFWWCLTNFNAHLANHRGNAFWKFNNDSLRSSGKPPVRFIQSHSCAEHNEQSSCSWIHFFFIPQHRVQCLRKRRIFVSMTPQSVGVLSTVFVFCVFARNYFWWLLCSARRYDARNSTILI